MSEVNEFNECQKADNLFPLSAVSNSAVLLSPTPEHISGATPLPR